MTQQQQPNYFCVIVNHLQEDLTLLENGALTTEVKTMISDIDVAVSGLLSITDREKRILCNEMHSKKNPPIKGTENKMCVETLPLIETFFKLVLRCNIKILQFDNSSRDPFIIKLNQTLVDYLKYAAFHDYQSFGGILKAGQKLLTDLIKVGETSPPIVSQLIIEECYARSPYSDEFKELLESRHVLGIDTYSVEKIEASFGGICEIFANLGAIFIQYLSDGGQYQLKDWFKNCFDRLDISGTDAMKKCFLQMFLKVATMDHFCVQYNDYFVLCLMRWTSGCLLYPSSWQKAETSIVDGWRLFLTKLTQEYPVGIKLMQRVVFVIETLTKDILKLLDNVSLYASPVVLNTLAQVLIPLFKLLIANPEPNRSLLPMVSYVFVRYHRTISKFKLCGATYWYELVKGLMLFYIDENKRQQHKLSGPTQTQGTRPSSNRPNGNVPALESHTNTQITQRYMQYRGVDYLWKKLDGLVQNSTNRSDESMRQFCNFFILFAELKIYNELSKRRMARTFDSLTNMGEAMCKVIEKAEHLEVFEDLFMALFEFAKLINLKGENHHSAKWIIRVATLPWVNKGEPSPENEYNPILRNVDFSAEIKRHCLYSLSYLKTDLNKNSRIEIIKRQLIGGLNCDDDAIAECVPLYLHSIDAGADFCNLFLRFKSSLTSRTLGSLCCRLAKTTKEPSWVNGDQFKLCYKELNCAVCSVDRKVRSSSEHPHIMQTDDEVNITNSFLFHISNEDNLLTDSDVYNTLASSGPQFFTHVGISEKVVNAIFELFNRDSCEAEKAVRSAIPYLIKPFEDCLVRGYNETLLIQCFREKFMKPETSNVSKEWRKFGLVAYLGAFCEDNLLTEVVVFFIVRSWTNHTVSHFVELLARSRSVAAKDLLLSYKFQICSRLIEILNQTQSKDPKTFVAHLLKSVSPFTPRDAEETQRLLNIEFIPMILSCLLLNYNSETAIVLQNLASTFPMDLNKLIASNLVFIVSTVVQWSDPSKMNSLLETMSRLCNKDLKHLLRSKDNQIRQQLFYLLSSHKENVCSVLAPLIHHFKDDLTVDDHILKWYFEKNARNYFLQLNNFLLSFSVPLKDKIRAVNSLTHIINLIGSNGVQPIKINLKAVLCTGLTCGHAEDTEFIKAVVSAWSAFIHNWKEIGVEVIEVCKILVPLLHVESKTVSEILNHLIVERTGEFIRYIPELYFFPNIDELQEAVNIITKAQVNLRTSMDQLVEHIEEILEQIDCENPEVKKAYLKRLRRLLQQNRDHLYHLCARSKEESVNEVIERLLKALVSNARIPNEDLRVRIAECIGEIGAIDPGRFEQMVLNGDDLWNDVTSFNLEPMEFGVKLVTHLASITESEKEARILDCVYYAIQEILAQYQIKSEKHQFFEKLPPKVANFAVPLLTSSYDYISSWSTMKVTSPVYNNKMQYKDWIFKWIFQLTSVVKDQTAQKIFKSLLGVVKYNSTTAHFILPFVLAYALSGADENALNDIILTEVRTIFKSSIDTASQSSSMLPCISPMENKTSATSNVLSELQHLSCQTLFFVLDALQSVLNAHQASVKASNVSPRTSAYRSLPKEKPKPSIFNKSLDMSQIDFFIKNLSKFDLSSLAFNCQSYARALLYMEEYLKETPQELEVQLETMQKYYSELDDVDGVLGVTAKRLKPPTLVENIVEHEALGELQHVLSCCEQGIKGDTRESADYLKKQLSTWMSIDHPRTAMIFGEGCNVQYPNLKKAIKPYMIEACYKLSDWDQLDAELNDPVTQKCDMSVGMGIGQLFSCAKKNQLELFDDTLAFLRKKEMNPIAAAAMEAGAYIRGYLHLVRLHMLSDLELGLKTLNFGTQNSKTQSCSSSGGVAIINLAGTAHHHELQNSLLKRCTLVQTSMRFQEPILSLLRTIIRYDPQREEQCSTELIRSWLSSAKLARKNGNFHRAYNCLLEAQTVTKDDLPLTLRSEITIQKAKYYWSQSNKESREAAVRELQKDRDRYFGLRISAYSNENDKHAAAKVKLLFAKYAEEESVINSNQILDVYNELRDALGSLLWEESYFCLAKYCQRLLGSIDKPQQRATTMVRIIRHLGDAIHAGCKHIYESIPVLFSTWFDLGSLCVENEGRKNPSKLMLDTLAIYRHECEKANTNVLILMDKVPTYYFLTAYLQLISRVAHPYDQLRQTLRKIISKLLSEYPKQTLWMTLGFMNNKSNEAHSRECCGIMTELSMKNPHFARLHSVMAKLSEGLIGLANYKGQIRINQTFAALQKSFKQAPILLPYQNQMTVRFPSKFDANPSSHSPLPVKPVHILSIGENVEIMNTLAQPKKIQLLCDDGKTYVMLCKPKDDLRQDSRVMEFMNLVNRHLKRDSEARKRELVIRTYTVVPLNHECGLVEWVNGCTGLRSIVTNLYEEKGISSQSLQDNYPDNRLSDDLRLAKFLKVIMKKVTPPVLSQYFIRNFKDPTSWYLARLAYTRSAAVMSIVGFIIGLGDRHLENILIEEKTGQLLHVDFNMIFNKGLRLEYPEIVPFRLTHNMIDAMGATGYDGSFRRTCETTLRIMRENREALIGVLTPFIYDPILEWKDKSMKGRGGPRKSLKNENSANEVSNDKALDCVKDIEDRLKGVIKSDNKPMGLPVSVGGHVSYLIEEATDPKRLSKLFKGWSSFY